MPHRSIWIQPRVLRYTIVVVSVASLALVLSGCGGQPASSPDRQPSPSDSASRERSSGQPFTSPEGYQYSPPAGWQTTEGVPNSGISAIFLKPKETESQAFQENVNIYVSPTLDSLQSLVAKTKEKTPAYLKGYTVIGELATALKSGQSAYELGGIYQDGASGQLENLQLMVVAIGKQFVVTYTASSGTFLQSLDAIQESFQSFLLRDK